MGGAKGGADFNPRGRSDMDVMRFCQAFMLELYRHIGPNTDVPAGDIGVGSREIGYLYGQYRRIANRFEGVLTGKDLEWGGSLIRPEATGYGATYFLEEMLKTKNDSVKGKMVAISGSGNVAQYATEKVNQLGGKVVTLSDSDGYIYDPEGIAGKKLQFLMDLKNIKRGRIKEYADEYNVQYFAGKRPWDQKVNVAMPCATQNELDLDDAQKLVNVGCVAVVEGANMPTTFDATNYLIQNGVMFAPGKAANAGGVATSGLEMSQNSMRISWTRQEVDERLHQIMQNIHMNAYQAAKDYGKTGNYVVGANIAGFIKVAKAMHAQGII
jgi:glutamate dehydrogenase/leucine dehydrogenase